MSQPSREAPRGAPLSLRGAGLKLPEWAAGTPGVLCAAGPHAIPVSTAIRAGDDRMLLALGGKRETLRLLGDDPRAAFCLLGEGVAFTASGTAHVVRGQLEAAAGVAAVELRVEGVQDHLADGRTEMLAGASWRWRSESARSEEPLILAELERLAPGS